MIPQLTCTHCHKSITVEQHSGRTKVACPYCDTIMVLPTSDSSTGLESTVAAERNPQPSSSSCSSLSVICWRCKTQCEMSPTLKGCWFNCICGARNYISPDYVEDRAPHPWECFTDGQQPPHGFPVERFDYTCQRCLSKNSACHHTVDRLIKCHRCEQCVNVAGACSFSIGLWDSLDRYLAREYQRGLVGLACKAVDFVRYSATSLWSSPENHVRSTLAHIEQDQCSHCNKLVMRAERIAGHIRRTARKVASMSVDHCYPQCPYCRTPLHPHSGWGATGCPNPGCSWRP